MFKLKKHINDMPKFVENGRRGYAAAEKIYKYYYLVLKHLLDKDITTRFHENGEVVTRELTPEELKIVEQDMKNFEQNGVLKIQKGDGNYNYDITGNYERNLSGDIVLDQFEKIRMLKENRTISSSKHVGGITAGNDEGNHGDDEIMSNYAGNANSMSGDIEASGNFRTWKTYGENKKYLEKERSGELAKEKEEKEAKMVKGLDLNPVFDKMAANFEKTISTNTSVASKDAATVLPVMYNSIEQEKEYIINEGNQLVYNILSQKIKDMAAELESYLSDLLSGDKKDKGYSAFKTAYFDFVNANVDGLTEETFKTLFDKIYNAYTNGFINDCTNLSGVKSPSLKLEAIAETDIEKEIVNVLKSKYAVGIITRTMGNKAQWSKIVKDWVIPKISPMIDDIRNNTLDKYKTEEILAEEQEAKETPVFVELVTIRELDGKEQEVSIIGKINGDMVEFENGSSVPLTALNTLVATRKATVTYLDKNKKEIK